MGTRATIDARARGQLQQGCPHPRQKEHGEGGPSRIPHGSCVEKATLRGVVAFSGGTASLLPPSRKEAGREKAPTSLSPLRCVSELLEELPQKLEGRAMSTVPSSFQGRGQWAPKGTAIIAGTGRRQIYFLPWTVVKFTSEPWSIREQGGIGSSHRFKVSQQA